MAEEVVPLFVVDPEMMRASPNRARFLTESLAGVDRALAHRGGRLVVREGDVALETARMVRSAECDELFFTRDVGRSATARAAHLERALAGARRAQVREFPGHAVVEPGDVTPRDKGAYRVFTPYLRAWSAHLSRDPLPAPRTVRLPPGVATGELPDPASWKPTAVDLPPGGETAARKRLRRFLSRDAERYGQLRDDMGSDTTSRLSPYLKFGCVSPVEVAVQAGLVRGADAFIRQLAWRDFFHQLRADLPSMTWRDLRPTPHEPRRMDDAVLEAWMTGRTGVPLVDAGMRQLQREGWMHNRARLVTASFLTRRAGIPWQEGADHFARHLVDGDPSNNAGNWQWVAGTGVAPRRGRPLSPVRQARRHDLAAVYVRRYVPELDGGVGDQLFRPWRHPEFLSATGYPSPIIDVPD